MADLGEALSEWTNAFEHVRRIEHYFLMRLVDPVRGEPHFTSPDSDEAKFVPRWAPDLSSAVDALTMTPSAVRAARTAGSCAPGAGMGHETSVGLLTLEFYIPGVSSLKESADRQAASWPASVASSTLSARGGGGQDQLGHTVISVARSHQQRLRHGLLERVAQCVTAWRLDAELVDYTIEML